MSLHTSPLLTESDVAQLLSCKPKTLQVWRWRGDGPPFIKVGSLCRYREQDVLAWLDSRRMASTSQK